MRPRATIVLAVLLVVSAALADEAGTWHREPVTFAPAGHEALQLVGELLWLERDDLTGRRPGVVLCHPDPRYGGTMSNGVVRRLADTLAGAGMVTLRFNFRGVGASTGSFGGGVDEVRDCLGALDLLAAHPLVEAGKLAVAGYSFGSAVALRASLGPSPARACACVAFPLPPGTADLEPYAYVRGADKPLLFVSGTEDSISGLETIRRLLKLTGVKAETVALPGGDHFFGQEEPLAAAAQTVCRFLREQFLTR